jgi:hypothetical protein
VTAYLQPPAVPVLNVVLDTQPKDLGGLEFTSGAPGEDNGAIGVLFVSHQQEQPRTWDGAGGGRETTYQVELRIFHRSTETTAKAAMDSFDAVVDAVCQRLRSDPYLGMDVATASQQGLISAAHEALEVQFGDPELGTPDGGWIETWAVVRFPVLEWNQPT